MALELAHREAFERRRALLAARLQNRPALIAAGAARPRNYAANVYPYRASSHFLYLVGLPLRGGVLLFDGGSFTLYLPEPGADDALWEGAQPTFDEIAAATGCTVRALSRLPANVRGRAVATVPAPDLDTCAEQSRLLQREIRRGVFDVLDAPLADALIDLRLRHDDAAVAELRAAAEVTGLAHRAGMRATRPGVREAAVRAAMEAEIIAHDLTVAYPSIVTVHGEILHNEKHHNVLAAGELLLADVGAESRGGFAGDVTRTWPVSGQFSSAQRELYNVVLEAQRQAIAAVTPGARYRNIHVLASQALASGLIDLGVLRGNPIELVADGVVALLFPHGVGHLLGLDVHDMEDLGDRAGYATGRTRSQDAGLRFLRLDRDLVAGMAVTIEPGLYFVPAILEDPIAMKKAAGRLDLERLARFRQARGIRIEDDVLVTETGAEVLTAAIPKSADAVEATLAG
ncbi:MAG TPA: aminopeptidase P family protein [Polyangia bacterium]|jgi:Xaa-Pro aminopeptidase|nr:aminopeptidase P family protein [Polyangia bacterium]